MKVRHSLARATLALLSFGAAAAVSYGQVGDAERGIRAVDFRNFTYREACIGEGQTITVTNGEFQRAEGDDTVSFDVREVVYGDLTGDGAEEAVVRTNCNTGGTGQFSDGTVFTMRGGKPVPLTSLGIGDRADGGIHAIRIREGQLIVDRYGQEHSGACCPEYIESERFRFDGKKFVAAAKPARRVFLSAGRQEETGPVRVRFLKGTSAATLSGSTNSGEKYVLGVRAGQSLVISFMSKDAKATVKILTPTGARLMTLHPNEDWTGRFEESGDHVIAIESPAGQDSADAYFDIDFTVR